MIVNTPFLFSVPGLTLSPLEQWPALFAQVALWHHQECARQGIQSSLLLRQQRLVQHLQAPQIPKTLVALREGELMGCVSLVSYSYRPRARQALVANDDSVWLSNLFVQEAYRRRGIGTALVQGACAYARQLGLVDLWLSASDFTDFYLARGWRIERQSRLGGKPVNVMFARL